MVATRTPALNKLLYQAGFRFPDVASLLLYRQALLARFIIKQGQNQRFSAADDAGSAVNRQFGLDSKSPRSVVPEVRLGLLDEGGHAFLLVFQPSSSPKLAWKPRRSKRRPSLRDDSKARLTDSLTIMTTGSEKPAMTAAAFSVSSSNWSAGMTRATKPDVSASAASMKRAVRHRPIAFALPTAAIAGLRAGLRAVLRCSQLRVMKAVRQQKRGLSNFAFRTLPFVPVSPD